MNKVECPSRAI